MNYQFSRLLFLPFFLTLFFNSANAFNVYCKLGEKTIFVSYGGFGDPDGVSRHNWEGLQFEYGGPFYDADAKLKSIPHSRAIDSGYGDVFQNWMELNVPIDVAPHVKKFVISAFEEKDRDKAVSLSNADWTKPLIKLRSIDGTTRKLPNDENQRHPIDFYEYEAVFKTTRSERAAPNYQRITHVDREETVSCQMKVRRY